jgi:uncharacterized NAD(P)/FAD-binding protein YdhS
VTDAPGRHHVVIGDGVSAGAFAAHAALGPSDRLTIVAPQADRLGRGLAYADHPESVPWRYAYLLNQPAIDIDPDFPEWLRPRWPDIRAAIKGRRPDWLTAAARLGEDIDQLFLPRAIHGDYLQERVDSALTDLAGKGIRVERRRLCATDIARDEPGFRIALADGSTLRADSIDVATGGPLPRTFPGAEAPYFVAGPYGNEAAIAEAAQEGRRITVIGANASMLDVLRLLQSVLPEERIDMTVIAPSGEGPGPYETESPPRSRVPAVSGPYETAADFLAAMDADQSAAAAISEAEALALRRGYMALFDERPLNDFLPDPREARRAATRIERRLIRGTRDSVHDFRRLAAAGRVRIIHGKAEALSQGADGARLRLVDADSDCREIEAGMVVSCAGPGPAPRHEPLAQSLIDRGWIARCPVTGGIELGQGLTTALAGLRFAAPSVTVIGGKVEAYPLYNGLRLRRLIATAVMQPSETETA